MSQFFNDHEIQTPGSKLINCGPEKTWRKKKWRIFKKLLFSGGLLNADKRQQIAKTIICIMFALLEIARIYKVLKLFADLQGPICYKDPQNKRTNFIVVKFAYHFLINYDLNL